MNAETLQILKMLYANENRQVFFLTTAGTCIWKNDISEPLKTEEDCIALLHTLQANTGIQTFWYHSLLYAAEILTSAELDCVILRISTASSAMSRWPRFSSSRAASLLPMPLSPVRSTPSP